MLYVKVINGIAVDVVAKPKWFDNNGNKIDDDQLFIEDGIYPLQKINPEYNIYTEKATLADMSNWEVTSTCVIETYNIESLSIDEIKKNYQRSIKITRNNNISANLNGFQVATSEDREAINGAIEYYDTLTSNGARPLIWTMADNTTKVVTKEELQTVKDTYVLRKATIFAEYQQKRAAIEAATTVEEINLVLEG